MEIELLRHAHTESWSDTGQDFDRPLSPEGRQQAQLAGRWTRQQDCVPDQIVASPALRTTQTAQWVAMMAGIPEKEISFERSLYNASPGELLKVIERYSANRLMIIAHNPGIEMLAEILS
ncbi:MAG: SixA phosphatase family protein, partial [bacterium]